MKVRAATDADHQAIVELLTTSWGGTIAVAHGVAYDAATLPALVAEQDDRLVGLLTYTLADGDLEVVTIDAPVRQMGAGSALLAAAIEVARGAGARRLWLITTNDNIDALRFYQRRGLRIVGVAPGAVDVSRKLKPSIPLTGAYDIPLRDELTLELRLDRSDKGT
jgi:ribosomal protein S18 acetylase RimI-like enzyme